MIYLIIFVIIIIFIWIAYEFYKAPYMDDDGNIKRKEK
jgi:uncharacterized membrane protein (DUF106 family)